MEYDLLRLKERIQIAIEIGESHFREFKSSYEGTYGNKKQRDLKDICYDVARTLVAFANADGGELFIGIEDDSTITGVGYNEKEIKYLLESPDIYVHRDTPLPSLKKGIVAIENKNVLFFSVLKGTSYIHITADGKCLQRKDLESVPISPNAIEFSRQEKESREYDRQFVDCANLSDLSIDIIEKFSRDLYKISAEKFLQYLDLGEFDGGKIRLNKAALLLFSKNIIRWHPRSQVRVIRVNGTELLTGQDYNVLADNQINDNIVMLIEESWELLRPHLVETKLTPDARFKTQVMYPELACREALINAIAHRDYSNEGRGVEIYIYDDRIEFISPGELLSSISINDIQKQTGVHQSRNTHVSRALKEIGFMRELGEGFKRIYKLLYDNELAPPNLESINNVFKVTMYQKTIYSRDEQLWLENFDSIILTRDEKAIVRMGYKGHLLSPQNIWDIVGIVDTDYYRQLLESLKRKGILSSQINKAEVNKIANKKKTSRKSVPRFLISVPTKESCIISETIDLGTTSLKTEMEEQIKTIAAPSDTDLDDSEYAEIYIGNVPYSVDESMIEMAFQKYGAIASVSLPTNFETNRPRGYGFIEFENFESARKACEEGSDIVIKGRRIYVERARNQLRRMD